MTEPWLEGARLGIDPGAPVETAKRSQPAGGGDEVLAAGVVEDVAAAWTEVRLPPHNAHSCIFT